MRTPLDAALCRKDKEWAVGQVREKRNWGEIAEQEHKGSGRKKEEEEDERPSGSGQKPKEVEETNTSNNLC